VTSVTGFLFPSAGFTPAQGVGMVSLLVLAIAILALYVFRLAGAWRWIYVAGAVAALYFNVAPTQSAPPFLVTQLVVMAVFIVLGIVAARSFHPEAEHPH
jgi:hypothetical protein